MHTKASGEGRLFSEMSQPRACSSPIVTRLHHHPARCTKWEHFRQHPKDIATEVLVILPPIVR